MMAKRYIDISFYQGTPDYGKVKSEVDGIIVRAGYGQNNIDTQFTRNMKECNRLGIPVGVYWFSYAYTEEMARQEAQYCLAAIKPYKVELPVCFDFEYDSVDYAKRKGVVITKELATKLVHAFCGEIEKAGYYAMNYTNPAYLAQYFDNTTLRYDLWLAQWPTNPNPDKPPRECGIWQYTSKGKVNGILGNVDMDAGYRDYPTIIRNAGLNNLVAKQEPKTLEERVAALEAWAKTQGME